MQMQFIRLLVIVTLTMVASAHPVLVNPPSVDLVRRSTYESDKRCILKRDPTADGGPSSDACV
ncbi:hypothetical protein C8R45DRAFT_1108312 [Mycena sanguinolenta]|nr:hypothetical protein C8R45DRAFT_1108312 [Mycena sanguinolenta]